MAPNIFIPQPTDMITPAMNLYKLMQQKKEFELDQQKQGSLQDYHKQMELQNKIQSIISLAKDQPEAAEKMFNSDPEMVQRNKGQIQFNKAASDEDWHVYEGGDGLYKINRKTGTMQKAEMGTPKVKEPGDRKTSTVQMGEDVVEIIESDSGSGQYEIMKINGKEVRGPKKPMVEVNIDKQEKEKERKENALTKASIIVDKVDEALGKVDYLTAGAGGLVMGKVPGTEAVDLEQVLETIRAQIGFSELAAMRRESPTGGALGLVAVRELELLSATLGSLDRKQSPGQLKKNLGNIKTHYLNWKKAVEDSKGNNKPSGESLKEPSSKSKSISEMSDDELLQELNK